MNQNNKFTIGLIINPISGMGGTVGLKGTDGRSILKQAINLGATPRATNRTVDFLKGIESIKNKLLFVTCPGIMGEKVLKEMNFNYETIQDILFEKCDTILDTTPEYTKLAAKIMMNDKSIEIIIFVGGDGTARDIQSVIKKHKPCLGIPAGVKIYSSAFALNPIDASNLLTQFLCDEIPLKESEVLDIDEEQYRVGQLVSKFYGYLLTPFNPDFSQFSKIGTPKSDLNNQERIANRIIEILEDNVYYLLGPGTTVKSITDKLHQTKTLLGIDLLLNKKIISKDLNEQQILEHVKAKKVKIITSIIGRQGFIFGRGNLQLSPMVLKEVGCKNFIIVATRFKLQSIPNIILKLDTRDPKLDNKMKGLYRIIIDYDEIKICEVR
ncbi:MAG: ATP-NAD kinase family protein [Promethearchaeota archaeon]